MRSCVILLNWNGWKDTIECLESVFRLTGEEFRVVVCDNASSDGSLEKIKQWARGELAAGCANPELSSLTSPPVAKPILYLEMTREQAESQRGGWDAPLILIQTGGNLGFAGGNNVGLRLALHDPDCQFFWLLNNDSVVAPAALSAMVRVMQQRPEVGLCGSLNLFYHSPDKVQAQGGFHYRRWRRWTARVRLGPPMNVAELPAVPPPMDYVHGASMLTSRSFLKTVGLMEESYFLYFEELDWALRARGRFELGYAPESLVFHKEGASIGSHRDRSKRSLISDQYLSRSRVLLSKRFFPWSLPSVILSTSLAAGYWFCRGDRERASIMLASILQALRMHRPIIGSNADPGSAFHS